MLLRFRMGDLVSCRARIQLKAMDRETGKGADLAENIAAKKAIEDAAGRLGGRLLPAATQKWNDQKK